MTLPSCLLTLKMIVLELCNIATQTTLKSFFFLIKALWSLWCVISVIFSFVAYIPNSTNHFILEFHQKLVILAKILATLVLSNNWLLILLPCYVSDSCLNNFSLILTHTDKCWCLWCCRSDEMFLYAHSHLDITLI